VICVSDNLPWRLGYGTVKAMEDSANAESAGESDSERRRRRRRRRKKKSRGIFSAETSRLLRLARWGIGVCVMLMTWAYGLYVIDRLGWSAAMFFPAGIVGMIAVEGALSIPFIAVAVAIAAFLWRVDADPLGALRFAGMACLGVGLVYVVWRLFVFLIVKREVTRAEAGYK
jgi:hypothetical protein